MIKLPTIIINFKTYNEASGYDAEELAKICKQISDEKKASIVCAPQSADIYRCAETGIEIFAQHGDVEEAGGHTGKISLKALKENGAIGVLINHSEDRIPYTNIENLIKLMHQTDLISTVCVRDVHEAIGIAKLHPDMIAIEPPELIGGDISVTTADPKIISQTVEAVHEVDSEISVLCGAGVKTGEDVKTAIELGATGVLIASGVTKAPDKKKAVLDLVKGLI